MLAHNVRSFFFMGPRLSQRTRTLICTMTLPLGQGRDGGRGGAISCLRDEDGEHGTRLLRLEEDEAWLVTLREESRGWEGAGGGAMGREAGGRDGPTGRPSSERPFTSDSSCSRSSPPPPREGEKEGGRGRMRGRGGAGDSRLGAERGS
jgi:hypothetical protein